MNLVPYDVKGKEILRIIIENKESLDVFPEQLQYFPSKDSGREKVSTENPLLVPRGIYGECVQRLYDEIWLKADGSPGCKVMLFTMEGTFIKYVSKDLYPEILNILKDYMDGQFIPDFLWDDNQRKTILC